MNTNVPSQPLSKTQPLILPPLTQDTITRAQQGLEAAQLLNAEAIVEKSLHQTEVLIQQKSSLKLRGWIRWLCIRSLIRSLFRVKIEGRDRLPKEPVIIAPNHLSHIDPFLILSEIPYQPYYYILGDARTLYNKFWKRIFLRFSGGTIPIERIWKEEIAVLEAAQAGEEHLTELAAAIERDVHKGNSIQSLRRLERIVQGLFAENKGILIFPEGRLGLQEGELFLPLKRGTVIYALKTGIPILPVGIIGTKNLYLYKELTIRFGQPLIFPQNNRPKPKDIQMALDTLQAALLDLLPKNYQEPDEVKLFSNFLNHMLW
ncbi:lysophospholipid acyltransferase family protein [Capilliphycus salinus ALCB114379]|uniref:lysophospholipid acyltransferase family protein n=1 Tax=Capilliphycus salinus TaxID=2768948 RepID=UPI0039A5476E